MYLNSTIFSANRDLANLNFAKKNDRISISITLTILFLKNQLFIFILLLQWAWSRFFSNIAFLFLLFTIL